MNKTTIGSKFGRSNSTLDISTITSYGQKQTAKASLHLSIETTENDNKKGFIQTTTTAAGASNVGNYQGPKFPSIILTSKDSMGPVVQPKGKYVLARRLSPFQVSRNPLQTAKTKEQPYNISENDSKQLQWQLQRDILKSQQKAKANSCHINTKHNQIGVANIFAEENKVIKEGYTELSRGPRVNKDGQFVPYTLIGPTQLFSKYLNYSKLDRQQSTMSNGTQKQLLLKQKMQRQASTMLNNFEAKDMLESANNPPPSPQSNNFNTNNNFFNNSRYNNNSNSNHANNNNQNNNSNNNSQQSGIFSDNNMGDSHIHFHPRENRTSLKMGNSSSMIGQTSTLSIHSTKKRLRNSDYDEVSKAELLEDMNKAKQRMKAESNKLKSILAQLSVEQKLLATKEERSLNLHAQTISEWSQSIARISQKNHRKPEDLLMLKSEEEHRKKVESNAVVHEMKSPEEKLGQRMWYLGLRKSEFNGEKKKSIAKKIDQEDTEDVVLSTTNIRSFDNLKHLLQLKHKDKLTLEGQADNSTTDIFSNFMTLSFDQSINKPIEIVRRSMVELQTNNNITQNELAYQQSLVSSPVSSFYQQHSPLNNSVDFKKYFMKNKMVLPSDASLHSLVVEGQNVFEKEIASLKNDGNPQGFKYERLDFVKAAAAHQKKSQDDLLRIDTRALDEEKIYESYYNQNELNKTGKYFFKDL